MDGDGHVVEVVSFFSRQKHFLLEVNFLICGVCQAYRIDSKKKIKKEETR